MARIRTIKPEISLHEGLFELERETGLPVRFTWAVLPCHCDREGRFKWRPRPLGAQILPYDGVDFSRVLDALVTRGFLVKYRVGDVWYGEIPTFLRHQVINNRESASELPGSCDAEEKIDNKSHKNHGHNDASTTREPRVDDAWTTPLVHAQGEGKGREGKGREGKNNMSREARDDVVSIFEHWQTALNHPKAKLDDKRERIIRKALKIGYSMEDLKTAITGCSLSPFNMGHNDNGTKHDSLDLILRNADKIDRFIAIAQNPPRLMGRQARIEAINDQAIQDWLDGDSLGFGDDDGTVIDGKAEHVAGGGR